MKVVDDVLWREEVDHAHAEGEGRVVEEVFLDVVQQPRLGQVLDVGEPILLLSAVPFASVGRAGAIRLLMENLQE